MNRLTKIACAVALAVGFTSQAQAETTISGPGNIGTGTHFNYMHTVYARAGLPEMTQLALTGFDKEFDLQPLAAESWSLSEDGLTWTFNLREGLVWSDGEPLTAEDFVFSLTHAATSGYDFAWYWGFAGGIKNWGPVTDGKMDVSELGIRQVDDLTIEVTTDSPKPYMPGVVSLWYPVPKHVWEEHGDEWAVNVDTIVTSGPYVLESWEKSNNNMVMTKSPTYNGPWQSRIERVSIESDLADPAVATPAYLAGEADFTNLNAGQVPFMEKRNPELMRTNVVFALTYLSFNMDEPPFDNADVRRAFWYGIDREEMTQTVLKGLAIPGNSLLTPGYPGYNADIAGQATFDVDKAREYLAAAGFPDGEGFPDIDLEMRIGSGYEGAISPPMAQYLQAEFKENLGIDLNITVAPISDWMDSLLNKKGNLYLSPYEFDYLDPSNFFGIFYDGGRHDYHVDAYDALVAKADADPDWETRLSLYEQAEQVMIDEAMIVPLIHPITVAVISEGLSGEGIEPNALGFTPLNRLSMYFYTHLDKN
jgi:oligopeptide transport system substrate-binding protein